MQGQLTLQLNRKLSVSATFLLSCVLLPHNDTKLGVNLPRVQPNMAQQTRRPLALGWNPMHRSVLTRKGRVDRPMQGANAL